jgi:hypothetical protein
MTYPRSCPLCKQDFGSLDPKNSSPDRGHMTVNAVAGGTPSPWRAEPVGRILTLRCSFCSDLFEWDYFASRLHE